ncbi:hypothetical protein [Streptosporangium sp. NPDC006007]
MVRPLPANAGRREASPDRRGLAGTARRTGPGGFLLAEIRL